MVIVPHHVYLELYDLVQKVKQLKKEAQDRASSACLTDADECAFWSAYSCGVGDVLDMIRNTVDHI